MQLPVLALILAAAFAGAAHAQDQALPPDYATQASIPPGTAPGLVHLLQGRVSLILQMYLTDSEPLPAK